MESFKKIFEGRLGRLHYFFGNLIILGIGTLIMIIYPNEYLAFVFTVLTLPITIRRLHDINLSGYLTPIGWLSYFEGIFLVIAIFFNLFLLFKKGSKEANQYGDAPKPGRKFIDVILNKENKHNDVNKKYGESNSKSIIENKSEKKKSNKENIIGLIFGISLVWSIGIGGLISYIIGIFFGTWITPKILSSQKKIVKIIFWIIFVVVFIIGSIVHGARLNSNYLNSGLGLKTEETKLLETDKSPNTSQVSENLYRNTKYHFRIKFPENWEIGVGDGIHIVQKASFENSTISITVQQFDLEKGASFSSVKDAGTPQEFADIIMESIKEKFSDVKIIGYGETIINNEPAYWIEYIASSQILDHKLEMTNITYCIAKGDTVYSINGGTATDDYLKIKPLFLQSMSTFILEN